VRLTPSAVSVAVAVERPASRTISAPIATPFEANWISESVVVLVMLPPAATVRSGAPKLTSTATTVPLVVFRTTKARVPSLFTATSNGVVPIVIVVSTARLAVLMTETVLVPLFVTSSLVPSEVRARPFGDDDTLMMRSTVLLPVLLTDTVLLAVLAT